MIDLKSLLKFGKIVVQCHDNPDPDTMACAFALTEFFIERGRAAETVYSGFAPLSKANLKLMLGELGITARYIPKNEPGPDLSLEADTLLLIADGQYGAGNVKKLSAAQVAVIDHHVPETPAAAFSDIRPFLGSCSTLVWMLLKNAGFDFQKHQKVSTALYYGLYTDTGGLSEITHPLDRDARDWLAFDKPLLKKLKNCNLAPGDLTLAGKALSGGRMDGATRSAVFQAEPCDPNILGFISDLALQVDDIDTCVVFCEVSGGVKLSVRSCVKEVMASELAARLCEGVGSGGGHSDKAGGFISAEHIQKSGLGPLAFLSGRYSAYFTQYDLVYCGKFRPDLSEFAPYIKQKISVGFVETTDIFPEGTEMTVRTLEGDTHIAADKETYIMVGIRQEIYPIKREKFERSYERLQGKYAARPEFLTEKHYVPSVKNRREGVAENIERFVRPCAAKGETKVFAKRLLRRAKVFTSWNDEGYFAGLPGDFLAVRADDLNDAYIIEQSIFDITYRRSD